MGPFIPLGGVVGVAVLCAVIWAVCRCCRGGEKDGGGGVSSSATGKHEGLLNKNTDVVVGGAVPEQSGGVQQRGPGPGGDGDCDVDLCAICKARLAEEGWGGCRRLRPCGHVYHVDCIGLWLQRRWVCPVCRADVACVADRDHGRDDVTPAAPGPGA